MNPNQVQIQTPSMPRRRIFSARAELIKAAAITASALLLAREIETRDKFNYRAMWYAVHAR